MTPQPPDERDAPRDERLPPGSERLEPASRAGGVGLPLTLAVCIGIALLLSGVSISLYYNSNLSRIDLSKPKYADIRREVLPSGEAVDQEEFDNDSPITSEALEEALKELRQRRKDLQSLGNFDSSVLDDAQLGIGSGN